MPCHNFMRRASVAVFWPTVTIITLVLIFGAYALIDGILAIGMALQIRRLTTRWWVILLEGSAGVIIGVMTFVWPTITALVLLFLIAAWTIITGALEIITAFSGHIPAAQEWTLALAGALSLLLGVLLALQSLMGLHVLALLIGSYAIVFGVLLIIRAFQHRAAAP
jgi:uncharacterized membrane protein HdeD (DUF308 family)